MPTGLAATLQELQAANGLEMAAVVSSDGLVVDAAASEGIDVESLCSVASNGLLLMDAIGQELGSLPGRMLTVEYDDRTLIMTPIDEDHLLILLSAASMNLGRLRIVARRHVAELADAVASL